MADQLSVGSTLSLPEGQTAEVKSIHIEKAALESTALNDQPTIDTARNQANEPPLIAPAATVATILIPSSNSPKVSLIPPKN